MQALVSGIRHVGVVVNDLDAAIDFWTVVLDFKVERILEESGETVDRMLGLNGVRVTTVKLRGCNETMVELLKFHSHPDKPRWAGAPFSTGLTHVALDVEDVDKLGKRLQDAGFPLRISAPSSDDGRVRAVYTEGPEKLLIELVETARSIDEPKS